MRVMVLMKATAQSEAGEMPPEEVLAEMGAYNEELNKAGVMLDGEGLHPSSKGKRVQFGKGKPIVVDGPFAETKELIAGYWMWQVSSMDEALEWIRRMPGANQAEFEFEVEVRPVFETDDFGDAMTPELREREERLRAELAKKK